MHPRTLVPGFPAAAAAGVLPAACRPRQSPSGAGRGRSRRRANPRRSEH